jgi:hypothetical protein
MEQLGFETQLTEKYATLLLFKLVDCLGEE